MKTIHARTHAQTQNTKHKRLLSFDSTQPAVGMTGDKRSFAMVKIAAHRLAGEKRKGWAAVNIVAEMCEALVR